MKKAIVSLVLFFVFVVGGWSLGVADEGTGSWGEILRGYMVGIADDLVLPDQFLIPEMTITFTRAFDGCVIARARINSKIQLRLYSEIPRRIDIRICPSEE